MDSILLFDVLTWAYVIFAAILVTTNYIYARKRITSNTLISLMFSIFMLTVINGTAILLQAQLALQSASQELTMTEIVVLLIGVFGFYVSFLNTELSSDGIWIFLHKIGILHGPL